MAARHLAQTCLADRSLDPQQQLEIAWETITATLPDADESARMLGLVEDLKSLYGKDPDLARQLCDGIELPDAVTQAELAAWTMLISTIYNLDITRTRS